MQPLGILPLERLALLPNKYSQAHEFCFFIHDQIARLLVEYDAAGVHSAVAAAFEKTLIENGKNPNNYDLIGFLKQENLKELYKKHLLGNLIIALTSDFCHFLYESLECFEKRKFIVAYSLLRKPLKENLLFLCWILADEDDFIKRFEKDNYYTLNSQTKEKRVEIYEAARLKLPHQDAYDSSYIWDAINSKTSDRGLEPIWQRATHLVTSQGDNMKTANYSLNLIFNDPSENNLYEPLYDQLPYLLTFCLQVILECFNKLERVNETTYSHLLLTTLGAYECIFSIRKPVIGPTLNKNLDLLLECIHCKAPLKITKKNGAQLYLTESMLCKQCNLISQVPLYWFFAKANLKISK